jgi:hypothetical protein
MPWMASDSVYRKGHFAILQRKKLGLHNLLDHEQLQETGGDDCLWKRRSQRPKSGDGLAPMRPTSVMEPGGPQHTEKLGIVSEVVVDVGHQAPTILSCLGGEWHHVQPAAMESR